jgi:hypothetical protein
VAGIKKSHAKDAKQNEKQFAHETRELARKKGRAKEVRKNRSEPRSLTFASIRLFRGFFSFFASSRETTFLFKNLTGVK